MAIIKARNANRTLRDRRAVLSGLLLAGTLTLGLQLSLPAHAHEQKVAISQILFNPNSGNIEIAHRLYLHDAEHAVQDQWGKADLVSDPDDLDKLALYVRGNFFLSLNDMLIEPTPVGVEVDDIYVWVYDEFPIPKKNVKTLTIDNTILRDVWREQANLVNVEVGSFRKSAFFSGEDKDKMIEIIAPK